MTNMEKTAKMFHDVINFIKQAFCVDGEVSLIPLKKRIIIAGGVKVVDSKRGTFYIFMVRDDEFEEKE